MCGVLGIVTVVGREAPIDDDRLATLRDLMTHRGPDGAGVWRRGHAALAHRRLAVLDPTPAGAQPMVSGDGLLALVYNGEIYNDAAVRRELASSGAALRTRCDTETVLESLRRWGPAGLAKLRGMFALGAVDLGRGTLVLARDPLGIKPLYFWTGPERGVPAVVFASEVRPIVEFLGGRAGPDWGVVSSYLTTIRTTLGERTLYAGVRALPPGRVLEFDLTGESPRARSWDLGLRAPESSVTDAAEAVREAVRGSVRAHLRSDVPLCSLLSGGLDSTIIAAEAMAGVGRLDTFAAGAPGVGAAGGGGEDLEFARFAADRLGTRHHETAITRELFAARWQEMVGALGLPLSTPNEVAIHEVAGSVRGSGAVVTLSGEGADELFGGYEGPLRSALSFEAAWSGPEGSWASSAAAFEVGSNAWVPPEVKHQVLAAGPLAASEGDSALLEHYAQELSRLAGGMGADGRARAHLGLQRRVNLAGLLLRLDQATMLRSVESRTPIADAEVAGLAESLPMAEKFVPGAGVEGTKVVLRRAFAGVVPEEIVRRPKASFPLPFQQWCGDLAGELRNGFASAVFRPEAVEAVLANPAGLWRVSWPMINLALWGRRLGG